MHPDDKRKVAFCIVAGSTVALWLLAVKLAEPLPAQGKAKLGALFQLLKLTPEKPPLLVAMVCGLVIGLGIAALFLKAGKGDFGGAEFRDFLRGSKVVSHRELARKTRERRAEQITVADIPIPRAVERLHLLLSGSTGSGKSVAVREMAYTALLRGDRIIAADPNGDMLSKFYRPNDVVLNPFDARGRGWSFFNEIRSDYDFESRAQSLVPVGQTKEEEEWCTYARLLLAEVARKLDRDGQPSIDELVRWTTIVSPELLRSYLQGTAAESLFSGADRALASARFILSTKLAPHLKMHPGDFSLRTWLENRDHGNLWITWREDMAKALRPLISAWVDILCTAVLSLPEDGEDERPLWMFLDELASLEKLPSLSAAATKGRKAGLRIVAGLQSTAQLEHTYGAQEAQTLRSCFRSLVVLGGAKTDPKTCDDMSRALGQHEVERDGWGRSDSSKNSSTSSQIKHEREEVVLASEIASLPDLTGYIAFAGDLPIAKATLKYRRFANRVPGIEERRPC